MAIDFDHCTEMDVNPIADHILVEDIEREGERIQNNIIILDDRGETRGIKPRWARVYLVGPEQLDVKVGEWVLIEHGRWSRGIRMADNKVIRKIDPDAILLVSDTKLF